MTEFNYVNKKDGIDNLIDMFTKLGFVKNKKIKSKSIEKNIVVNTKNINKEELENFRDEFKLIKHDNVNYPRYFKYK